MILRQYGLRLEDTLFRPSCAKNSVLDQLYKGRVSSRAARSRGERHYRWYWGAALGGLVLSADLFGLIIRRLKPAGFDGADLWIRLPPIMM